MCYGELRDKIVTSEGLSDFQRRVYLALLDIPRGETITYGELARCVGCRSAQAVGQALKRNPFAPEVPCHRVVAADGSLCGYRSCAPTYVVVPLRLGYGTDNRCLWSSTYACILGF